MAAERSPWPVVLLSSIFLGQWASATAAHDFPRMPEVWLMAEDFHSTTGSWRNRGSGPDLSGIVVSGTAELTSASGHGATGTVAAVQGTSQTQLQLGNIVPTTYTICTLTRYAGNDQRRILQGCGGGNWLHGHWEARAGLAHYGQWKTDHQFSRLQPSTDWLVMCGSNSGNMPGNVRMPGLLLGTAIYGSSPNGVCVNTQGSDSPLETSDFAIAEIVVFDGALSDLDVEEVLAHLEQRLEATTTSTLTTTTTACHLGEELRNGACERCPLDHEGTGPGVCEACTGDAYSFGGSDYCRCKPNSNCQQCPPGEHSLGTQPCKPVLDHMVASLDDPELTANPDLDDQSRVTLQLKLDELLDVFEDYHVFYVIDIKVPNEPVVYEDTCFDHHASSSIGVDQATIALEYDDLSEDHCALSQDYDPDGTIVRTGETRIFVRVTIGSETREVRRWTIPLTLKFDPETHSFVGGDSLVMDGTAQLGGEIFALSPFSSTLSFMDENFGNIISQATYNILDTVHVQHKLEDVSDTLDLEVIKVVLSESIDAGVADAFVRELTHTITVVQETEASEARFTFLAQRCEDCYLHVVSRVVHTDLPRRLGGRLLAQDPQDLFVLRSLPVTMLPAQPTSETQASQVNLTLVVRGVDYNSLVARSSLREQFIANLKSAVMDSVGDGVRADDMLVTLSPGSVKASVAIRAPTPDDTLATMATLEDPAVQSTLKEAVAQSVATMEDVHLISNGHISTELISIEIVQVVPDEALNSDRSQSVEPWVIAAAATTALFGALAILASVCFLRRRAQRKRQQQYGKEDVAVSSKDVAPMDAEVEAASEDPDWQRISRSI